QETCAVFGSRHPDKFGAVDWHRSESGQPLLDGSLAWIDCTVETVHEGGDHYVVYGRVHDFAVGEGTSGKPLLFYRSQYTGIAPEKSEPAPWRDDLEAVLLPAADGDTWPRRRPLERPPTPRGRRPLRIVDRSARHPRYRSRPVSAPPSALRRGLTARHVGFIALGSAIGTGLFYGSAEAIR